MTKQNFWTVNKIDNSTAEILVYGYIGSDDVSASDFVRELKTLETQCSNINVRINSGGGSIFEGLAIFNAMRNSKANIETFIDGMAASMGTVIALGGKKVHMSKIAMFMTHRASGVAFGSADDMRQNAQLLEGLEETIVSIYAAKTGCTTAECKDKYLTSQDKWFTAAQALQEKLIDSIYDGEAIDVPQNIKNEKDLWGVFNNQFKNSLNNNFNMKQFTLPTAVASTLQIADNADQAAFENAINLLVAKANKADQLDAENKTVKDEIVRLKAEAEDQKITGLVEGAITDKKFPVGDKSKYMRLAAADFETTKSLIDEMKPYISVAGQLNNEIGEEGKVELNELQKMSGRELYMSGKLQRLQELSPVHFKLKYKEAFGVEYKGE